MKTMLRRTTLSAICVMVLLGLAGCKNEYEDKVVGTWKASGVPLNFTFNKDKSGSMKAGPISKSFTWRMRSNNLILKMDGKESGGLIEDMKKDSFVLNDPKYKKKITFTRVTSSGAE